MKTIFTTLLLMISQTHAAPSPLIVCKGQLGSKPVALQPEFSAEDHLRGSAHDSELGGVVYLATVEGQKVRLQIKSESSRTSFLDKLRPLDDAQSSIRLNRQTEAEISCQRAR